MTINLKIPDIRELKPRITVFGVGGAGGNAVNNMITAGCRAVDFVVANTDAQALTMSKAERIIQMGVQVTEGLGAGSQPEVGRAAAEEVIDEIRDHLHRRAHGVRHRRHGRRHRHRRRAGGRARCAKELGILTVGVVTKPFHFEGLRRMRVAEAGIAELQKAVDTLLIIPNQNLFRVANEKTTFADAFAMADQVLYSGVACITDLMVKEGLINLDFADVRAVMREMGKAMMGTGEASGEKRALARRRGRDLQSADRRRLDEGRQRPADLDHRRQGPHALRGRRGRDPHPRGGRPGRQHHRRRDLRREPRRHHPRVGGGDRHRRMAAAAQRPARDRRKRGIAELDAEAAVADRSVCAERVERARVTAHGRRRSRTASAAGASPPKRSSGRADRPRPPPALLPMTAIEDVTIRPIPPKPSLFPEPADADGSRVEPPAPRRPFIPPQAERPAPRAPRMPRIDELPIPAQNADPRASAASRRPPSIPKSRADVLLQRLASVGLGRREEEAAAARRRACRPMRPARRCPADRRAAAAAAASRPAPRAARVAGPEPVSEYAKRPAAAGSRPRTAGQAACA